MNTINRVFHTHVDLDPKIALLSYLDGELFLPEILVPINRLLFIAYKTITMK